MTPDAHTQPLPVAAERVPVEVAGSWLRRLLAGFPTGSTLPHAEFARRHRLLLGLLWAHVGALVVMGYAVGAGTVATLIQAWTVATPAALATWVLRERRQASALVAVGLVTASAVVVHLTGGYPEAHFHFFVVIAALTLYEDWVTFGLGIAYVLVHLGFGGLVAPETVFDHPDAIAHPWKWAGIYAAFVGAAGALGMAGWRLNEELRRTQREALERARAAEEEARRAADELARSNQDLLQFASVASHDLSEPLRTVSAFLGLLERRYAADLDEQAQEWIGFAVDGSQRMKTLIDDLLSYSRAGRAELRKEPVALDELVGQVRASLGSLLDDAGAEVTVGPLPTVHGDPGQLGLLVQNLLANATKFVDGAAPRIVVDAEPAEDGMVCVSVADNGIGIPEEKREAIFEMFGRLHGRSAYEGSGIGLAVCQRVVTRHGGRVWVEAADGGGSRFRFTLPTA